MQQQFTRRRLLRTAATLAGAAALAPLAACGGAANATVATVSTSPASAPTTAASVTSATTALATATAGSGSTASAASAATSSSAPAAATTTSATAASLAPSGAGSATSSSASAAAKVAGKTEVTYIDSAAPVDQPAYKQVVSMFEAANPGVTVNYSSLAYNDFINKAFPSWVASGTFPDVYIVQGTYAGNWAAKQWLARLDDLINQDAKAVNTADFWPAQVQSELTYQGHWYVLPWDFGDVGAYVNKDLFRAAGIAEPTKDWTWDDVQAMAQKLTKGQGDQQTQWGFGGYPRTQEFQAYLWANGGAFLSDDGKTCVVDDPQYADKNAAALQYYADLGQKYHLLPTATPDKGSAGFFASKVGINLDGSWQMANYRQNIQTHFSWDTQWWPVTKATGRHGIFASGAGYGMSPVTKQRDAAWAWLQAVSSTAAAEVIVSDRLRGLPGRQSALPAWQKAIGTADPQQAKVFIDMLGASYPRKPVVFWTEMYNLADEELGNIWSGKRQAHEVLGDWQQRMNVEIAKYKDLLS
jgi:multiple sugar transport system substrate-binding protein